MADFQKIKLAGTGVEFSYVDSGAPDGRTVYRTLIALHGYGWNASGFASLYKIEPW
jgi:hypothetical protein